MKRARFSEEHVIRIRKAAEVSGNIREARRDDDVTGQTFCRRRRKFDGMDIFDTKKLKDLERENSELKHMVAEQALDIRGLNELNSKNGEPGGSTARKERLRRSMDLNECRFCRLVGIAQSTQSRAQGCAEKVTLTAGIQELSNRYPRFGYWKIFDLLGGAGLRVEREQVRLLRRTKGLRVPRKNPK